MDYYDNVINETSTGERNMRAAEKIMHLYHKSLEKPAEDVVYISQTFLHDILVDISAFQDEKIFPEETQALQELVVKVLASTQ